MFNNQALASITFVCTTIHRTEQGCATVDWHCVVEKATDYSIDVFCDCTYNCTVLKDIAKGSSPFETYINVIRALQWVAPCMMS